VLVCRSRWRAVRLTLKLQSANSLMVRVSSPDLPEIRHQIAIEAPPEKVYAALVATCNSTWGELMYRLKGYVDGKNPGPHWRQ
jgi:hypothetical protein